MNYFKHLSLLCFMLLALLFSCKENIDTSNRYVFRERTIASYLTSHEQFSDYVKLLKAQKISDLSETSVYQLMTAYGAYTCFAPTNEALQLYLDSLVIKEIIPIASWDSFPSTHVLDSVRRVVVMNSILDGTKIDKVFPMAEFPQNNEEFSVNTMEDRKISATYAKNNPDSCFIDGICPVSLTNRDIEAINGYIHELGYVIAPSNETLGSTLHRYAYDYNSGYSVMAKLVEACRLIDTLSVVKDDVYEMLVQTDVITDCKNPPQSWAAYPCPEHRKYGFTLFAETDEFWAKTLGKDIKDITVIDVKDWIASQNLYPDAKNDENYTSEDNLLNQFVTYHIIPQRIPVDKLVIHYNEKGYNYKNSTHYSVPVWTHFITMGKRRLVKTWQSVESNGIYLNRFPVLDNGRHGTYHELSCDPENEGIYLNTSAESNVIKLINAMIYPIDKVLAYDDHTRDNLARTRLRYDSWDFLPEMMNNDMRHMGYNASFYFPNDQVYSYFRDCSVNTKDTYFYILNGWGSGWPNYQGDEMLVMGIYDITLKLPPVPRTGTWEIRMGVSTESSWRGICQVYFGTHPDQLAPAGIPVDMALGGLYRRDDEKVYGSIVGWERDTDDDDYNAEVDKRMKNNGFMKGPEYIVETPGGTDTNRSMEKTTRRIILRTTIDADKTYYMRFKSCQDQIHKQLFIDYMEWCPKEVFDNPIEPEDIW